MGLNVDRAAVVREAQNLIGVRWVHQGRDAVRGFDCVGLVVLVPLRLGLITPAQIPPPNYSMRIDGTFLHHFRSYYLTEISPRDAQDGDVVVFIDRNVSAVCHCGIMAAKDGQPGVIHAYRASNPAARRCTHEALDAVAQSVGIWTHAFKFPGLEA